MYLTREDLLKIESWLYQRTIKDTQMPLADSLKGDERMAIVQAGENRQMTLDSLIETIGDRTENKDFYNVTANKGMHDLPLEVAINEVPHFRRRMGLVITFHTVGGSWSMFQFTGDSFTQWNSTAYWEDLKPGIIEMLYRPDEEDLTAVKSNGYYLLKFRDKQFNPTDFSGKGRKMLRKRLVWDCVKQRNYNVLTQDDFNEPNTIYIIQYDFDLQGAEITLPKGSVLWFHGGSLNNGTVNLNGAAISGAYTDTDMGTAVFNAPYHLGQIMYFKDEDYIELTQRWINPGPEEHQVNYIEHETEDVKRWEEQRAGQYYREFITDMLFRSDPTYIQKMCATPESFTTLPCFRPMWWNGEKWANLLDERDYDRIYRMLNELNSKIDTEVSSLHSVVNYFKDCYAQDLSSLVDRLVGDELRIDTVELELKDLKPKVEYLLEEVGGYNEAGDPEPSRIDTIEEEIDTLKERVDNIDPDTSRYVKTVSVNGGDRVSPDDEGNVDIEITGPGPGPDPQPNELLRVERQVWNGDGSIGGRDSMKWRSMIGFEYDGSEAETAVANSWVMFNNIAQLRPDLGVTKLGHNMSYTAYSPTVDSSNFMYINPAVSGVMHGAKVQYTMEIDIWQYLQDHGSTFFGFVTDRPQEESDHNGRSTKRRERYIMPSLVREDPGGQHIECNHLVDCFFYCKEETSPHDNGKFTGTHFHINVRNTDTARFVITSAKWSMSTCKHPSESGYTGWQNADNLPNPEYFIFDKCKYTPFGNISVRRGTTVDPDWYTWTQGGIPEALGINAPKTNFVTEVDLVFGSKWGTLFKLYSEAYSNAGVKEVMIPIIYFTVEGYWTDYD